MSSSDIVQDAIQAWQRIKDPRSRREALRIMDHLIVSSDIEKEIEAASSDLSKELVSLEGG